MKKTTAKYMIIPRRKSIHVALSVLLLTLWSCGDFLEVEPQNVITQDQFWNEESDVENIIAGCYSGMESYGMISRMMIWGEFRSENVIYNTATTNDANLEKLLKENITADNGYTDWTEFYGIINRCNTVIKYAPEVAAEDPSYTESEMRAHIAEVTALRSLCYFYLIRTFRDVPYSEEPYLDDSQTLAIPATPFNEVLGKLISSLETVKNDALLKYPEVTDGSLARYYNTARITRSAIYAMLCEMYLWNKDYDKCIEYADLIIEQKLKDAKDKDYTATDFKNFNGYPLIASKMKYSNMFGNDFNEIFVTGNSMESIFELNFEKGSGSSQQSNGPVSDFYGGRPTPYVDPSTYVGKDESDGIYNVFDAQNKGYDSRQYTTIRFEGENPSYINKYSCSGSITLLASNKPYESISYYATYGTEGKNYASLNKSNWIIYRLTDIMLLKAEALTQKIASEGALEENTEDYKYLSQAFTLVNAVNKRSLLQSELRDTLALTSYNTKKDITNLVYQERERELMFEGKRYYDLVRRSLRDGNTEYLCEKVSNKGLSNSKVVVSKMQKMDAIFWPYNITETKVNKNLIQNTAFGSGENSSYEKSAN